MDIKSVKIQADPQTMYVTCAVNKVQGVMLLSQYVYTIFDIIKVIYILYIEPM